MRKNLKTRLIIAILLSALFLVVTGTARAMPNPAAVYCTLQGYKSQIRTDEQGNQYGVCVFPDGSECGEWDYYCKCEPNGITCWPGDFSCHWPCKEMRCKEAGECVLVSKCCEGLDEIFPPHIFDANCNNLELIGWLFLCSDCGNGTCESWESKCNCPEDCGQPRIIYVDANAPGANNGSSWENAYPFLQDALADANSSPKPVEIRVAEGIYTPDSNSAEPNGTGDREATFQLINGVVIKGGYAGVGEPDPNARDVDAYQTILSGDLDGNDVDVNDPFDLLTEPTRGENCRHVVTACETDANAVLDGVTITGGNANGDFIPLYWGAGIYNENTPSLPDYECTTAGPAISNCTITRNSARGEGGGIYNRYSCQPQIINCTFVENTALWCGGAIKNDTSNPAITDCLFERNYAGRYEHSDGGAIDNEEGSPVLTNCTFIANQANYGGAVGNWMGGSSPTFANCIFAGNSAKYGGAMWITNFHDIGGGSHPEFVNCTFVGNSATYGTALACTIGFNGVIPSDIQLVNCILWDGGNEIYNDDGSPITVSYSDILGGSGSVVDPCGTVVWGAGNIDASPRFANPGHWDTNGTPDDANDDFWVDGDYHLKSQAGRWEPVSGSWVKDDVTSPCIDKADPMNPVGPEPFPNGGIINMGTYGGTIEASKSYFGEPVCETIVAGDINGDCKVNFEDFALMAAHWLRDENP